jgi:hypothetical protein
LGEKIRTFDNEVCEVKHTVFSVETSVQYMSEVFEEVKTKADQDMNSIRKDTRNLDRKVSESVTELQKNNSELLKSVIDLKSRSMRDNLVFTGIPESKGEVCGEVLRDFMKFMMRSRLRGFTEWVKQMCSVQSQGT